MTTINHLIRNIYGLSSNISHSSACFLCHLSDTFSYTICHSARASGEIIDVPNWDSHPSSSTQSSAFVPCVPWSPESFLSIQHTDFTGPTARLMNHIAPTICHHRPVMYHVVLHKWEHTQTRTPIG